MSSFPDYYELLKVTPLATLDEIRAAYKKESLKWVTLLSITAWRGIYPCSYGCQDAPGQASKCNPCRKESSNREISGNSLGDNQYRVDSFEDFRLWRMHTTSSRIPPGARSTMRSTPLGAHKREQRNPMPRLISSLLLRACSGPRTRAQALQEPPLEIVPTRTMSSQTCSRRCASTSSSYTYTVCETDAASPPPRNSSFGQRSTDMRRGGRG